MLTFFFQLSTNQLKELNTSTKNPRRKLLRGQITKESLAQLDTPNSKPGKSDPADKSEKGKDKKTKTPMKDANGNVVKKPLTAYMLFNNYRRPMLRSEHPGKRRSLLIL